MSRVSACQTHKSSCSAAVALPHNTHLAHLPSSPCPAMIKRQRGSSPIPFPSDPTHEADVAATDLYEPDAKRRRYFAPIHHGNWQGHQGADSVDADSGDEVEAPVHDWRQRRPRDNGEYGKANQILHDLHAEQRHRLLFTSSPHSTNLTPQYHQHYSKFDQSTSDADPYPSPPKIKHPPEVGPPRNLSVAPPTSKYGYHSDSPMHGEGIASEEAALVSHRYEDTNRCATTDI